MAVIYPPGQEPDIIKVRLDRLFAKLDATYPDKVIFRLEYHHKKASQTITELYRLLGYEDRQSFLAAYGYTTTKRGALKTDIDAIVARLQRRYEGKSKRATLTELQRDNPDLSGKIRSMQSNAMAWFGMSKCLGLKVKE